MVRLIASSLSMLKTFLLKNKRLSFELILGVLTALSVYCGIVVYNNNKKLSERLEQAQNNIEAYQDIANDSQQACGVLIMQVEDLQNSKDRLIQQIDSVSKEAGIKHKAITSAATQTQSLYVNKGKGVGGQDLSIILKDTIYTDSIKYNDETTVYYTIGKDTVNIALDINNTQYLYTYKTREYKNKKNFFKRLFTLDFKKVDRYKYTIVNSNDLIKEDDIRIIEIK